MGKSGQESVANQLQQMTTLLSGNDVGTYDDCDNMTNLQQALLSQAAALHMATLESQQKMATMFMEALEKFVKHAMDTLLIVASLGVAPASPPAPTSA